MFGSIKIQPILPTVDFWSLKSGMGKISNVCIYVFCSMAKNISMFMNSTSASKAPVWIVREEMES